MALTMLSYIVKAGCMALTMLHYSVKAGCMALPPLLTIKQVMQQRQCSGVWSAKDELPVSSLV